MNPDSDPVGRLVLTGVRYAVGAPLVALVWVLNTLVLLALIATIFLGFMLMVLVDDRGGFEWAFRPALTATEIVWGGRAPRIPA